MKVPKIVSAEAIDNSTLMVEFSNGDRKQYNVSKLLEKPMFSPLKNSSFFRGFQIDAGGYGIAWNDEIDLSEYELWQNGTDADAIVEGDRASVAG
jgi:Protein of unknown function (DUF2442)